MEYDPVKDRLQAMLGQSWMARRLFFAILDRLFLRARYVRSEIERLKRAGFQPIKILDAGSGFGQYSFRLMRTFPEAQIIGLDLKPELVESCQGLAPKISPQARGQTQFVVGDLLALPYQAEFDLILSVDVMEHIAEDQRVFDNFGRALREGGYLVMTTPYYDEQQSQDASTGVFVGEHVRPGYSKSDLTQKLDHAGMALEAFVITYGRWGKAAWTLLQKWPMSWLASRTWLVPLVALYMIPAYLLAWVFMQMDLRAQNTFGGGILAMARKSLSAQTDET